MGDVAESVSQKPGKSAPGKSAPGKNAASKQIRGSSLLLFGRFLSIAANFGVQVLTVRYLTKSDFGAFAYALSIVSLGENVVTLGLDRAVTRFIPIYEERGERGKLAGTLLMVTVGILGLGLGTCLLVFGLQNWIAGSLISDPQAVTLILILIFLSPLQALDGLVMGLFAVFSKPRAVFVRRHVLTPVLKLSVVLLLIVRSASVEFLAVGYVAAGAVGLALYAPMMIRLLRRRGLLQGLERGTLRVPYREVLSFTLPLLSSDLVYSVMTATNAILLGRYGGTVEVAAFRAVQPAARLNQLVFTSFTLLFTPLAARLFARGDRDGINRLYWQTAIWMAVFSFPVFSLTFSLAEPLTATLYGSRYAESATYLALMSLGYYFNSALGFNGLTLKVFGILRYIVVLNLLTAATNLVLSFLLIPRFGALGAAIGTCATLLAHNVLKQWGLRNGTGISLFEWRYARIYLGIAGAALVLWLVQVVFQPGIVVTGCCAALASLGVLRLGRSQLDVAEVFPELVRSRVGRWLFQG